MRVRGLRQIKRIVSEHRTEANHWLIFAGTLIAVSMLSLGVVIMMDARREAWRDASRSSENLAISLERDINRSLSVYDLSLKGAALALKTVNLDQIDPTLRQEALFDRAALADHLGAILVLDAQGNIEYDSNGWPPRKANLAQQEYFRIQRDNPTQGLFISGATVSPLSNRKEIALSRRIEGPNGEFRGVVVGTVELLYFQELFDQLNIGNTGSISVVTSNGRIVARHPYVERDIGMDISHSAGMLQAMSHPTGSLITPAATDGVPRMFTFRHIGAYPLVLFVGVGTSDVLTPWRHNARQIGAVLLMLCIVSLILCMLVRRELRLRSAAEEKLIKSANDMAQLARSDGLTGLANRRQFDTVLEQEWRRVKRSGGWLSLLLMDADNFKKFNDHYGHQAGDVALRAIAASINGAMLRSGDLGARYGGEEFAAILPDTDLVGACAIAERVRSAVAAREILHEESEHRTITISVGVASVRPLFEATENTPALLREADIALYEAKATGRNRIVSRAIGSVTPLTVLKTPDPVETDIDCGLNKIQLG